MRSIKYLLGTVVAIVGLTALGMAHDPYDSGYGRSARREHRNYHTEKAYEHDLYHQYSHSRRDHKRYHRELKLEHRDEHRYRNERRYYERDTYGSYGNYRRNDPYYNY